MPIGLAADKPHLPEIHQREPELSVIRGIPIEGLPVSDGITLFDGYVNGPWGLFLNDEPKL